MFPTHYVQMDIINLGRCKVAIPSNRVNVSYTVVSTGQSGFYSVGRNPLKSGQCFLLIQKLRDSYSGYKKKGRNPLKSGQCFLLLV